VPDPTLTLYNTLTRRKEPFAPIDPANVRMYVCGPTVYDRAHIGNARPIIVFDVLFRLLRHIYGADHVTYARNITDVDDKINARSSERYPSLPPVEAIRELTTVTTAGFHEDISTLGVLSPTIEPRATDHIKEMVAMCEALLASGHAYIAEDHVLFDVPSMPDYGQLSGRTLAEMEAGARVEVEAYKRNVNDFVLWKPSKPGEPSWPSPKGVTAAGRPGWHIECSAMAGKHLGAVFDIHGGGHDLIFPHHENEIAQSRCAHGTPVMANVWVHNGFLNQEGEKMSKSLGNIVSIRDLVAGKVFGGQQWHGKVVKLAMLSAHHRQPMDWTVARLAQMRGTLMDFAGLVAGVAAAAEPHPEVVAALADDLNTPSTLSILHGIAKSAARNQVSAAQLKASLNLIGVYQNEAPEDFDVGIVAREVDAGKVEALIEARNTARKAKDFKEADRIRAELDAMGVALKDARDPATGAVETTWELKR